MIILSHVLEKSSRTGARASWAGRKKGRKGGSSSPLSIFSSRRLKCAPNCRPAILSVRAQAVCRPGDSASPGRLQPISLRETLLFEKWSRTLRVCLMADFYAYAPLAAAAGARASWAGRTKGGKGGSSSPLSIFSSRRLKSAPSLPDGRKGGESIFYALSAPSQSSLFSVFSFPGPRPPYSRDAMQLSTSFISAVGSKRATTFPFLSTINFVKFHLISGLCS